MRNECEAILDDHIWVVYAMAAGRYGPTKIGITSNLSLRVKAIQTGSWQPLQIFAARPVVDMESGARYSTGAASYRAAARRLEARVHQQLEVDGSRLMGEWFDLDPGEVIDRTDFRRIGKLIFAASIVGF